MLKNKLGLNIAVFFTLVSTSLVVAANSKLSMYQGCDEQTESGDKALYQSYYEQVFSDDEQSHQLCVLSGERINISDIKVYRDSQGERHR
jgi:hypothetical protein